MIHSQLRTDAHGLSGTQGPASRAPSRALPHASRLSPASDCPICPSHTCPRRVGMHSTFFLAPSGRFKCLEHKDAQVCL